jgi:hypothetical protein
MDNIKYLEDNIVQVKVFIADTEERMAAGEEWLDASYLTLKRHLKDLCKQLAEAREPELVG